MAETFDSLGRIIGKSINDIAEDINSAVRRVVTVSEKSTAKLTELVGRLESILKTTKNADKETKRKNEPSSVRIDPKDLAVFQAAAKAFEKATQTIDRKEKTKPENQVGFAEKALDLLGKKLDSIYKAVSGDNLVTAAERMVDTLSKKTLNVHDSGLTKTTSQILSAINKKNLSGTGRINELQREKTPNGFYASLNRMVKAGLTKGSIYTHDFANESLLTEIMNDIKLSVVALREIAYNSGVSKNKNADMMRLSDANLKSRRLDTLQRKSIVTDDVSNRFMNRRGRGGRPGGGGSLPGIREMPGSHGPDPASISDLEGNIAGLDSSTQQLVKALGSSHLGLYTKELAQALGTIPKYLDRAMVGFVEKILESGQMSQDQLEMAAKAASQSDFMDASARTHVKSLIDQLNRAAIELATARRSGTGDVKVLEKNLQDKYVQVLNGLIKSYKNIDGSLATFDRKIRDVSYALYDMQRVVGITKPSSYGISPEIKFGDPKGMAKEFGATAAEWDKKISAATFEAFGTIRTESDLLFKETGNKLSEIYKQTGMTGEEFRDAFLKNVKKGITDLNTLNKITRTGGTLGKIIGADAGQTAEEFADWHLSLGLSTKDLDVLAKRTVQIGRVTGITGDNLLQSVKAARQFADAMRDAGTLTAEAAANFMQISTAGKKLGVENDVNKLLNALSSSTSLLTEIDDTTRAFLFQAARNAGVFDELMTGTIAHDKDAQKKLAEGMEAVSKLATGGLGVKNFDKMTPQQKMMANLQLKGLTGFEGGKLSRIIQAFEMGSKAGEAIGELTDLVQTKQDRSDFSKLEFEANLTNQKLQEQIEKGWNKLLQAVGPDGMLKIQYAHDILGAATNVVNELQIISQGLVGLAALKFIGGGMFGKSAPAAVALGKSGRPIATPIVAGGTGIKGGAPAVKGGLAGIKSGEEIFGKGVGTKGTSAAVGAVKGTGTLGKILGPLGKIAGPLALLDLAFGGFQGFQESGGKLSGTLMGILTGGNKTGSFMSKHLGIEEGSAGDKALGIAGAAGRGAMAGATVGALFGGVGAGPGAIIGGIIGGVAELIKVLGGLEPVIEKISNGFSNLWKSLKQSFGPVLDNLGKIFSGIGETFGRIAKNFGDLFSGLGIGNGGFLDSLMGFAAGFAMGGPIAGLFTGLAGLVVGFDNVMKAVNFVGSVVGTVANGIVNAFGIVVTFGEEALGFFSDIFKDWWGAVKDIVKSIGGEGFLNKIGEFFRGFREGIGEFFDKATKWVQGINEYLDIAFFKRNFREFFDYLRIKFNEMLDFNESIFDAISLGWAAAKDGPSAFFRFLAESWNKIIDGLSGTLGAIYKVVAEIVNNNPFSSKTMPAELDTNVAKIPIEGFVSDRRYEAKKKEIAERNEKRGFETRAGKVSQEIQQREESKFYNPATQLQGTMDAIRDVTTRKEIRNLDFDTHLLQGEGVKKTKVEDLVKELKGEVPIQKADTRIWLGEKDNDNKGIIRDTGVTFGGTTLKAGEAEKYYNQLNGFINFKWHAGWKMYSDGLNTGDGAKVTLGKALMKEAGQSKLVLDSAYTEAMGGLPKTAEPLPKPENMPAGGPGMNAGAELPKREVPKVPNITAGGAVGGALTPPNVTTNLPSPFAPGSPSILGSTGGLPFREPKTPEEIADVAKMNKLAMDIAPIFHRATKDKMVNLRTLDIIAADIYGQTKNKPNVDSAQATKEAFKRHLGVDIDNPATFSPLGTVDKISEIEKLAIDAVTSGAGLGTSIAPMPHEPEVKTAAPNALNQAGQELQKQRMAAESEKAKIEEGNAHLEGIEGNTQKTNEEIKKLTEAIQILIGIMSGGDNSRISGVPSLTRPMIGAPPNYYMANMSPNNQAGMGATLPRA